MDNSLLLLLVILVLVSILVSRPSVKNDSTPTFSPFIAFYDSNDVVGNANSFEAKFPDIKNNFDSVIDINDINDPECPPTNYSRGWIFTLYFVMNNWSEIYYLYQNETENQIKSRMREAFLNFYNIRGNTNDMSEGEKIAYLDFGPDPTRFTNYDGKFLGNDILSDMIDIFYPCIKNDQTVCTTQYIASNIYPPDCRIVSAPIS